MTLGLLRLMEGVMLLGSCFLRATKAQQTIVTEEVGFISDPTSCAELLPTHKFSGTCCSLSVSDDDGCNLSVVAGYCLVSGPVWFLNITSTDSNSTCPVGDLDPLGDTSDGAIPTVAPITDDSTSEATSTGKCAQNNECGETFCGSDGDCYDHTCENLYRLYPLVEYNPELSSPLECRDGTTDIHITNFGCGAAVGRQIPSTLGVGEVPNQICTGRTVIENDEERKIVSFECFGFRNDTDFTDFENRVAEWGLACPDPTVEGLPAFFYSAGFTLSLLIDGALQASTNVLGGPGPTNVFVRERAMVSSFAVITIEEITPSPTMAPDVLPEPPPTNAPPSAARGNGAYWSPVMLALILTGSILSAVLFK